MKIGIIGLGYIGTVTSAGLLKLGHTIVGYDIDLQKIEQIANKMVEFPESEVSDIINCATAFSVTSSLDSLLDCDAVFICVPTEPKNDGSLNVAIVFDCLEKLRNLDYEGEVGIRSTLDLRSIQRYQMNTDATNLFIVPEFLREGSALSDFLDSEITIIGSFSSQKSELIAKALAVTSKQTVQCHAETAIFTKMLNNTWHALKVAFGNEWAFAASNFENVDIGKVHEMFIADNKLNISAKYMKPGGPFGGPCLPKDTLAFKNLLDDSMIITDAVLRGNESHIERLAQIMIDCIGKSNVRSFYIDDINFKAGTNDSRFSPALKIIEYVEKVTNYKYVNTENSIIFNGRLLMDQGIVKVVND